MMIPKDFRNENGELKHETWALEQQAEQGFQGWQPRDSWEIEIEWVGGWNDPSWNATILHGQIM